MKLPKLIVAFRKFPRKLRKLPFSGCDLPLQIVYLRFERLNVCHSAENLWSIRRDDIRNRLKKGAGLNSFRRSRSRGCKTRDGSFN